ncbi:hypothetical protein C0R01_31420 [Streptomyces albidoflavus]|uniref:Uncharacterized protein n=1 Tax=Streptomyces sp. HK1 TaxID=405041 RepID=B0LUA1_9ACTN|nr:MULTISPECIES: hypothetical protein [Streptomyces]ABY83569.1 hypothetical protein pSHK1.100 [Streptomyces sp. HK1]QHV83520.1 hypothetical protein C3K23_00575 [Streptomyces sp. 604F]RZE60430.1 hypothetical protein C0R00_22875 [Streptomyces albidoflavus]RZE66028.1 hypothetical protein C0R01_31420 [Streptomyces albidoflavus]
MGLVALFRTLEYRNLPTLAKRTKKTGYIEHCQAVRLDADGEISEEITDPGTAWMELDVLCTKSAIVAAR